jgi:hypothetical protein
VYPQKNSGGEIEDELMPNAKRQSSKEIQSLNNKFTEEEIFTV